MYRIVGSSRAVPGLAFMLDCFALDSIIYVICFDIYHSTIHVFAFVKARQGRNETGRARPDLAERSIGAVVIVLHITAAHPII